MAPGPLAHLRVLDLTDLRGALAGRLLADLGAAVWKVEPSSGDPDRWRPPFVGDVAGAERSLSFLYRHANKHGFVVDDLDRLHALCAEADVLVENLSPQTRQQCGLEPDAVRARHPQLVHVVLADFGCSGPRATWQLEALPAFAASGALFSSGLADRAPCWLPGYAAHDGASAFGCIGAMVALLDRARSGIGQTVEISVQEAALAALTPWSVPLADYARLYPMMSPAPPRNGDGNYLVLPVADGHVRVLPATTRHWRAFVRLLGVPDALAGAEWEHLVFRIMNHDVIRTVASAALRERTRADVVAEGWRLGVPIAPINRPEEFVAAMQTRVRGYFQTLAGSSLDDAPVATAPFVFTRTPVSLRRAAPVLREDHVPLPRRLDVPTESPGERPPLAGCFVVSLGVVAVGPEIGWMLAELGAEVVKIESRAKLDPLREVALDPDAPNRCFTFNDENRGQRSVCLDLSTARGRELALALCARADVVVENNRGGVARAWGLDYADVRRVRPDVVYVVSQGFGRGGPLGEVQGFGPLNGCFAGAHWLWNHEDSPYPAGSSLNHPDHVASKLATVAVLAALEHRRRTGEGQLIDMAQTEAAAFLLGEAYLEGPCTGRPPMPHGNAVAYAAPHGVYPCAGDDHWCAIAVVGEAAWSAFRGVAGWDDDPSLSTIAGRLAARVALDARVAAWTAGWEAEHLSTVLQAAGVSAMPVLGPDELRSDAHLLERGAIAWVDHPEVGPARHVANPIRMSRTRLAPAGPAPLLGEGTEDVLARHLGLSAEAIRRLADDGVCR